MEDVIKMLKRKQFRIATQWTDTIIDGDSGSLELFKLLRQYDAAISILEKAENNTGS